MPAGRTRPQAVDPQDDGEDEQAGRPETIFSGRAKLAAAPEGPGKSYHGRPGSGARPSGLYRGLRCRRTGRRCCRGRTRPMMTAPAPPGASGPAGHHCILVAAAPGPRLSFWSAPAEAGVCAGEQPRRRVALEPDFPRSPRAWPWTGRPAARRLAGCLTTRCRRCRADRHRMPISPNTEAEFPSPLLVTATRSTAQRSPAYLGADGAGEQQPLNGRSACCRMDAFPTCDRRSSGTFATPACR